MRTITQRLMDNYEKDYRAMQAQLAEQREKAVKMVLESDLGFATGHADTFDDLMGHVLEQAEERFAEQRRVIEVLVDALDFYADPEQYFAISFFADPPCGSFADDFEPFDENFEPCKDDYPERRDRPGKMARAALTAYREAKEVLGDE